MSSLVVSVLQSKTDEELHRLKVSNGLKDVLAKSGGKVSEAELNLKRDDFISICMKLVPRELSRRLVATTQAKKDLSEPDLKIVHIDFRTWQRAYFITVSGLDAASAPSREDIQSAMLKASEEAYGQETKVTHLAIFRERHQSGKIHFHIASQLSARCRWVPWKKALMKHSIVAHFNQIETCRLQYQSMLRYCFVPTNHKPLEGLDQEPLLYHCDGRHPPLMDAIHGSLDAEAVSLSIQDKFLQRGGRTSRFMAPRPGPVCFETTSFCLCFCANWAIAGVLTNCFTPPTGIVLGRSGLVT
eukprot:Skav222722  [mRNA]  locus=scaffold2390:65155:66054:- [translate_table: standard]